MAWPRRPSRLMESGWISKAVFLDPQGIPEGVLYGELFATDPAGPRILRRAQFLAGIDQRRVLEPSLAGAQLAYLSQSALANDTRAAWHEDQLLTQVGLSIGVSGFVWAELASVINTVPGGDAVMGPEVQQVAVAPAGSLAIDPTPGNGVIIDSGLVTTGVATFDWNMGTLLPGFLEAEMYLQTLALRPNGTQTFTNRIRLDVEQP